MNADFDQCLAAVLHSEGGYVCNPNDPGGATMDGVTQAVYDNWRASRNQPSQPVKLIDKGEIESIYRDLYWGPVKADQLPSGLDYALFDFAFNSGPEEAIKCLQRALGTVDDGILGPLTMTAANNVPVAPLIDKLCDERLAFLKSLRRWKFFGNGWKSRVADVRAKAKAMAT